MRRAGAARMRRGGSGRNFDARKVAVASEGRERRGGSGDGLAVGVEGAHAHPVVEGLQRKVQVLVGFQFQDHEARVAVEREQVEHTAIAAGERGNLVVDQIAAQLGKQFPEPRTQTRLQPALGRHAEERIGVRAIGVAAEEKTAQKIAAQVFIFGRERGFARTRAEGDFVFAREGVSRSAVTHAGKFQAMQQYAHCGCGMGTDFNALARGIGDKREKSGNAGLTTLQRSGARKGVDQA